MKKILSIAAVSVFATSMLTIGANASEKKSCCFSDCANELKTSVSLKNDTVKKCSSNDDDEIIRKLLEECEKLCNDKINHGCTVPDHIIPDNNPNKDESSTVKPWLPPFDGNNSPETDNENNNSGNNESGGTQNGTGSSGNTNQNIPGNTQSGTNQSYINEIVSLVNKERAAYGLQPVTANNTPLSKAAQKRAQEQATLFSHTRPSGNNWSSVLSEFGVSYRKAGENVAYGQQSAKEVMNAWMNSSGHRANILNEEFTEIGVGVYNKNGTYYWSQLFIG